MNFLIKMQFWTFIPVCICTFTGGFMPKVLRKAIILGHTFEKDPLGYLLDKGKRDSLNVMSIANIFG